MANKIPDEEVIAFVHKTMIKGYAEGIEETARDSYNLTSLVPALQDLAKEENVSSLDDIPSRTLGHEMRKHERA